MKSASPTRILVMVCVLHAATHMYTTFLAPLNGDLKRFFGLTLDSDVTFFFTVYLVCYGIANLVSGLYCNIFQARTLLAFGPIVNGACVLGMSQLSPSDYSAMCWLQAGGALGGGFYHPVANKLVTRVFPDNKGKALGIVGIGACVAFVAAPWTGSFLVHSGVCTWQTICLAYGAIGIACGISALLFVPRDESVANGGPPPVLLDDLQARGNGTSVTQAVTYFTAFMVLVIAGREIASWGITAVTQQYTATAFGRAIDPGLLVAAVFAPGLIVQPLAGRWSDTLGRERVLSGGLFVLAAALFAIPFTPGNLILLPYLIVGAAMTATVPTSEALFAERCPIHLRGHVFGFAITAGIALGALGPKMVGAIADAGERTVGAYRNAFYALAGVTLASALFALFLKPVAKALDVERFGLPAQLSEPAAAPVAIEVQSAK